MPERDYSKGQIYTIRCRDNPTLIYVGSTINTLPKRLGKHKTTSKQKPDILLYKTIAGNWDRYYIELYELYPCGSKNELERREGQIIREIGTLNYVIAGRTSKEYAQDNKDKIADYMHQYQQENKEKLTKQMRQYYQDNKEKINEQMHQYFQENKDKILERNHIYHQNNKEKIAERRRQYRQENKEKISGKKHQYYQDNKEKILEQKRQYSERKKAEKAQAN